MRVALQSPVRTTVAILVTDGTEYALRGADGSRESGPVHRALLWEVARLDLTPEQAVDVILGVPGLAAALSPGRCYAGPGGELRLELVDEAGRVARVADFDAEGRLSRLEVRDPAQQPSLVVRLSDYAVVAGTPLAHELSIEAGGVLATLNLSDAELNPALPADIFRVELPSLEGEGG